MSVRPRIYVSGRMTGLPEFNFPAFHQAAEMLRGAGWDVENPAESFGGAQDRPYKDYVAFDIAALKRCDAIYMLKGWDHEGSRGAVWEHGLAEEFGLDIWYQKGLGGWAPVPRFKGQPVDTHLTIEPAPADETSKTTNPKDAIGSDKLPLHLFPTTAVALGSLAMLEGALKYGRSNFRAIGVRASIYYDAMRRHMDAWLEGEDIDPDSGINHLGKALACIAILIDASFAGKLNDDRMVAGGYAELAEELTPMVRNLKERHRDKTPKHYTIADATGTP